MVVHLQTGEAIRGTIEYYDADMVKIVPPKGPGRFLRKSVIMMIHPDPDA